MIIQFDDSIIEDKEAESNRALRELSAGVLSKVEYREKIFGETKEIAEKEIQEIEGAEPDVESLLGTKDESKETEEEKGKEEDKKKEKKQEK